MRASVSRYWRAVSTTLLAGVAGLAGSYAVAGNTPTFVAAPVSAFVVMQTPASVIAFSIQTLGHFGDLLGFLLALVLTVLLLSVAAFVGAWLGSRIGFAYVGAILAGLLVWAVTAVLTGAYVASIAAAVPAGVVVALGAFWTAPTTDRTARDDRRHVVGILAGVAGFSVLSYLLGNWVTNLPGEAGPAMAAEEAGRLRALAAEQALDVEGIPGLVSEIDEFYEVDVNSIDPSIDASEWRLSITGEVENPRTLTYEELLSMPAQTGYNTLRCVGEGLNATLMDNAIWTAVTARELVEAAGPRGGCECVMLRAADDYYEEFPLAALLTGFLAYTMNGQALPRSHGYPVRALIPGHWGEINVKWLTEIEVLDREVDGFWEERGWHGTGPVTTVAKVWTVNRLDGGAVQVGGHAYAGIRGIDRVEVSIDGGETWTDAEVSEPMPEADTLGERDAWRQWQYTWTPSTGSHEVVVRAVDGEGNLQPRESRPPFPDGASGWVSEIVDV